jgi:hypothetical protein
MNCSRDFVLLWALTLFAVGSIASGADRIVGPDLRLLKSSQSSAHDGVIEMRSCAQCDLGKGMSPSPLLEPIAYFRDPNGLKPIPRTHEAAGELVSVGMITRKDDDGEFGGTATLITPCHVLTNYHVAFGKKAQGMDPLFSLKKTGFPELNFYFGQGSDRSFAGHTNGTPVAWGNGANDPILGAAEDWAVVRLNQCVGMDYGYWEFAKFSGEAFKQIPVNMAGLLREADVAKGIFRDEGCAVAGEGFSSNEGGTMMYHTCSGVLGASGAPIYALVSGHPVIVGLNSGGALDKKVQVPRSGHYNIGPLMGGMSKRIIAALKSGPESDYILASTGQKWTYGARLKNWVKDQQAQR